jgi:protein SYS1
MAGTFRYTVWDPIMIVCQMATLQCAYYVSLGLWIFFFDVIGGMPRSLEHIFKYEVRRYVNGETFS